MTGYRSGLVDPAIMAKKAAFEQDFKARIMAKPDLKAKYGRAWDNIAAAQKELASFATAARYQGFTGSTLLGWAGALVRLPEQGTLVDSLRLPQYRGEGLARIRAGALRPQELDLEAEKLLLAAQLCRTCKTTFSRHNLSLCRNLLRELEPTAPNQVWVSDVTYIRTDAGFEYLTLIMDRHSRKIVGYSCGDTLDAEANLTGLRLALAELPDNRYPIHHSDRGCQYCCHEYVDVLLSRHLPISMTEENHCYENSHAERLNGILKQEYAVGVTFRNRHQARRAVDQAVWLYNYLRPHGSLHNQIPATVHTQAA